MEYSCLLCSTQNQVISGLAILVVAILYFLHFLYFSRKVQLKKIATKYGLEYEGKEVLFRKLFKQEVKYNLISGSINGKGILFFDYYNSEPKTLSERIDEDKETSDVMKGLAQNLIRKEKLPAERFTAIEIGNSRKMIGARAGTWNLANYSTSFCPMKIIKKIFSELEKDGSTATFNNLKDGDPKGFYWGSYPFVRIIKGNG
ncbi:MAG: hypothetical protein AAB497_03545 [Patescibacteria group bacterium]